MNYDELEQHVRMLARLGRTKKGLDFEKMARNMGSHFIFDKEFFIGFYDELEELVNGRWDEEKVKEEYAQLNNSVYADLKERSTCIGARNACAYALDFKVNPVGRQDG